MQEKNCNFVPIAKDSSKREPIPYICGLRARIECEPLSEHSTRSDRVTNIGYRLSLGASVLQTNQNLIKNLLIFETRWYIIRYCQAQ